MKRTKGRLMGQLTLAYVTGIFAGSIAFTLLAYLGFALFFRDTSVSVVFAPFLTIFGSFAVSFLVFIIIAAFYLIFETWMDRWIVAGMAVAIIGSSLLASHVGGWSYPISHLLSGLALLSTAIACATFYYLRFVRKKPCFICGPDTIDNYAPGN